MEREFLSNFKVGDVALPDVVIDAIMKEHQRDLEAATTHPGENGATGGKTFTQDEVNRIVSDRLAREREKATQPPQEDEREKALKAREARLDCREYLDSKKYPAELMEVLDISDVETFKATVGKLMEKFPDLSRPGTLRGAVPAPYAAGAGTARLLGTEAAISDAFKPPMT